MLHNTAKSRSCFSFCFPSIKDPVCRWEYNTSLFAVWDAPPAIWRAGTWSLALVLIQFPVYTHPSRLKWLDFCDLYGEPKLTPQLQFQPSLIFALVDTGRMNQQMQNLTSLSLPFEWIHCKNAEHCLTDCRSPLSKAKPKPCLTWGALSRLRWSPVVFAGLTATGSSDAFKKWFCFFKKFEFVSVVMFSGLFPEEETIKTSISSKLIRIHSGKSYINNFSFLCHLGYWKFNHRYTSSSANWFPGTVNLFARGKLKKMGNNKS